MVKTALAFSWYAWVFVFTFVTPPNLCWYNYTWPFCLKKINSGSFLCCLWLHCSPQSHYHKEWMPHCRNRHIYFLYKNIYPLGYFWLMRSFVFLHWFGCLISMLWIHLIASGFLFLRFHSEAIPVNMLFSNLLLREHVAHVKNLVFLAKFSKIKVCSMKNTLL